MSPNFFLFFIEISVFLSAICHFDKLSDRNSYFLSMTFFAASTMWAASIP